MKPVSKRKQIFQQMDWLLPTLFFPHGVSGAVALLLGLVLTLSSLVGDYTLLNSPTLHIYCGAIFVNATSGILIANRAPVQARALFRFACLQQIGLIWFAFRFRPAAEYHFPCEARIDTITTVAILAANCAFAHQSLTWVREEHGNAVAGGIVCGVFGITLMVGYPIHLAIGGDDWLQCIVDTYPRQLEGFSGYVYVPTTWMFSAMLFGGTLLNRKVIGGGEFGAVFGGGVVGVLVLTVLSQEVHIPGVSTQRLIIPCPPPQAGSLMKNVVNLLDTSVLAQKVLGKCGMVFKVGGEL